MTIKQSPPQGKIGADEKITPVMFYTANTLIHGELVTKLSIRVNTLMRTQMVPDYLHLLNARILIFPGAGAVQSLSFQEYFITPSQVIAYHTVPPVQEPLDFDPSEPNRKLASVTILFGSFRLNGSLRISMQTDVQTHLSISREIFLSLYEVKISNPIIPNLGILHIPLVLLRPGQVSFAIPPSS
jgi:hypothetical protein